MSSRKKSRDTPNEEAVNIRSKRLSEFEESQLQRPDEIGYLLESGNKKVGYKSSSFESVFVWNIPPVSTCPGRSKWCSQNCYNGDDRPDVYDLQSWGRNWWGVQNDQDAVKLYIMNQLKMIDGPTALRIHSSGDFLSVSYVNMWLDIVRSCPNTSFWGYTRSWVVPDIRIALENLRLESNIQLFASWDNTMLQPPEGWRISFVDQKVLNRTAPILDCPEQYQLSKSITCAECRYCISDKDGDVFFVLH